MKTVEQLEFEAAALGLYLACFRAQMSASRPQRLEQSEWARLVDSKVAAGMSRVEAIRRAAKARPDLYAAQTYARDARDPVSLADAKVEAIRARTAALRAKKRTGQSR
jgi:hypothetical protein